MEKKIEKGSEEFLFFSDLFKFKQNFYELPKDEGFEQDAFLEEMFASADNLVKKYKTAEFNSQGIVKELILNCVIDVDKRYQAKKGV